MPIVTNMAGRTANRMLRSIEFITNFGKIKYEYSNIKRELIPILDANGEAIALAMAILKLSANE